MEKDYCQKCHQYNWVELHHILPECEFGDGETIKLCPTCHTDYHILTGFNKEKGLSMEHHFEKFYRWLAGLSIAVIVGILLFSML
jgi:hypothetical protein